MLKNLTMLVLYVIQAGVFVDLLRRIDNGLGLTHRRAFTYLFIQVICSLLLHFAF